MFNIDKTFLVSLKLTQLRSLLLLCLSRTVQKPAIMNKLLIVLLAVCLVNVHAFVKRDAPTTEKNILEELKNTLSGVSEKISAEASRALNPEELKKNANAALDTLNKAIEELKSKLSEATTKQ